MHANIISYPSCFRVDADPDASTAFHFMFKQLQLLHRVGNDNLTSTIEFLCIYASGHITLIFVPFFLIRVINSPSSGFFKDFITALLLLYIVVTVMAYNYLSEICQSVTTSSRSFLRSCAENRGRLPELDKLRLRSYSPIVFSLACSLPINKPTFAVIASSFTLKGLLKAIVKYHR
jgi:hypothetical protein